MKTARKKKTKILDADSDHGLVRHRPDRLPEAGAERDRGRSRRRSDTAAIIHHSTILLRQTFKHQEEKYTIDGKNCELKKSVWNWRKKNTFKRSKRKMPKEEKSQIFFFAKWKSPTTTISKNRGRNHFSLIFNLTSQKQATEQKKGKKMIFFFLFPFACKNSMKIFCSMWKICNFYFPLFQNFCQFL